MLESVRLAAYLLAPIIPSISTDIYQQLGFAIDFNEKTYLQDSTTYADQAAWIISKVHQSLNQPKLVFASVEQV